MSTGSTSREVRERVVGSYVLAATMVLDDQHKDEDDNRRGEVLTIDKRHTRWSN